MRHVLARDELAGHPAVYSRAVGASGIVKVT